MKQIRKMSNLVAEELQSTLDEQGITLDENVFEAKVSSIVSSIYESVEDIEDAEDDDEEVELTEELIKENSTFYYVGVDTTIGGEDVAEGEYVEIEDGDEGEIIVTIYDEDGDVRTSDILASTDELEAFLENAEELEDDEDDVEEAKKVKKFKVKDGKKVKLTKDQIVAAKLKARGKAKKGYKIVNGKQVKMTAAEKKARKMNGKKLAKKGKAKRAKSLKKARQLAAGAQSGTVSESFDITSNGMTFTVMEGDEIQLDGNTISVIREGVVVFKGLEVSEGFLDRCVTEEVLTINESKEADVEEEDTEEAPAEEKKEAEEVAEGTEPVQEETEEREEEKSEEEEPAEECDTQKADEAAILSFNSKKGYVLTKEGSELPMGNRVRARATLISEGFNVTSEQLDKASAGELVTL